MEKQTFKPENFNKFKNTCVKIISLCNENVDGSLMTIQLICLAEVIKEFNENPIVKYSGVR